MTTHRERTGDDHGEEQNDAVPDVTGDVTDNSYIKADRSNEDIEIPVVSDETARSELDDQPPPNSDDQLAHDDNDAIDQSNIIDERTRGAQPVGTYSEGPDEDDLPIEALQSGKSDMS